MLGPFATYVPPGVYTRTLTDANVATLVAGLRIPTIIGVGQEELEQDDVEIVRGSSSTLDEQIVNEDVSESWVVDNTNPLNPILGATDGTRSTFKVKNFPIVDGQGFGKVTNDIRTVAVTVDGTPVALGSVQGSTGLVTLQVPPSVTAAVRVTYFFHRGDTAFTDDVSSQVSRSVASLLSPGYEPFNIVAGTTDTFVLTVNGTTRTVVFTPLPALKAGLTIPGVDSNGGVIYTAQAAGTAGNSIRVAHVVSGTSTPLSISVSGNDITVHVQTDGSSLAISTAAQVVTAIGLSAPATALVTATATGSGASVVGAQALTFMAGGSNGGTASAVKAQIDGALISGLSTSVFVDNQGLNHIQLSASNSISIGSGNANGALGFTAGQATSRNTTFQVFQRPIVDGSGGGVTTTDPSKVVVKVSGTQVIPTQVDGKNGLVTLAIAPASGSTVTVQYWANTWQDTFDYLPNSLVTSVLRCGFAPGRSDFLQGPDFIVTNPSPSESRIHWGAGVVVASTSVSPSATPLNSSQITPTLVDDRLYLAPCTRFVDTSVVPSVTSTTVFVLPEPPTTGNGRDTPLGLDLFNSVTNGRQALDTNRPDLVIVRTGRSLRDAMNRSAAIVTSVDSTTLKVTLRDPVPPDHLAFATFWYNRLVDDTYIVTCATPGPVGTGQYTISSALENTNLFQVKFGTKGGGLTDTVNWPRGVETIPDAFHFGGTPVPETVTVTFGQSAAENAIYTTKGRDPYSFYAGTSATWITNIDGSDHSTTLSTAAKGYLVGGHVPLTGGNITIASAPNNVLNLTVDTGSVTGATNSQTLNVVVNVTPGSRTPSQIVTDINTAIDAALTAELGVSTTGNVASTVTIGTDALFILKSFSTPASLPGGFDAVSYVRVNQGTVESVLGLTAFTRADGTPGAINKPATMVGSLAQSFAITAALNDQFKISVNGNTYSITLTAGASRTAAQIVTDINGVVSGLASVGTLGNLNKVRLTSSINTDQSSIIILDGSANATLGFSQNQTASQTRVSAQEVTDELMATGGFVGVAVAYPTTEPGLGTSVTIESLSTGSSSSVAFTAGSNSAFNVTTGVNITPGVDGDNGEAAQDKFTVSSSNSSGSAGTGTPGQTYTDSITGLRFTILPATDGSYTNGGTFTLLVGSTFTVSPSIPTYAIPGCETTVSNTVGVGVNDTGTVQTFNPGGQEPAIGDFYFVSYLYQKQDFSTRIFSKFSTITANFGPLSPENRATLGAYLSTLNGAVLIGIKQVLKVPNTNQASPAAFIQAIQDLATPLPGNVKPDILVPLSTDTGVFGVLNQHVITQSQDRNQAERMGFIGVASGTSATTTQAIAKSLASNRMVLFFPDSSVITLTDELGNSSDSLIDGSFFAAAVSGAVVSPLVDVATPYTRRRIQGFTSIPTILDPVTANQTAVAGVTILEDLSPVVRIRQGLTTDMTNVMTRLPSVTQIADYVQQQTRGILDSFIGTKFLSTRTNEVEVSLTSLFKQLIQQQIIGAFTGISAAVDPNDPTILNAVGYYQPIFPLLYLSVTYNLRARI